MEKWAVGVMVQGKQKVAFDDMVLTAKQRYSPAL
jgi:hypothetical protein